MRRLILAALMGLALGNGCIIQLREPQRLGWDDPQVVTDLVDSIFGNLRDILENAK